MKISVYWYCGVQKSETRDFFYICLFVCFYLMFIIFQIQIVDVVVIIIIIIIKDFIFAYLTSDLIILHTIS